MARQYGAVLRPWCDREQFHLSDPFARRCDGPGTPCDTSDVPRGTEAMPAASPSGLKLLRHLALSVALEGILDRCYPTGATVTTLAPVTP